MVIDWTIVVAGFVIILLIVGIVIFLRRPRRDMDYYARLMDRGNQARERGELDKARKQYREVTTGVQRLRFPEAALVNVWGKALLALGEIN